MSVRVMAWVWDNAQTTPTQKLTLLAIADCANDEGTDAYPSIARLCRKTNLSERAVQTAIADLVAKGELEVRLNAGPRGCNRYRVMMGNGAAKVASPPAPPSLPGHQPPQDVHPAGDAPLPAGDAPRISRPPHQVRRTPAPDAGVPPHEVRPNHPLTVLEPSVGAPTAPPRRGTRIPDDFHVTDEMRAWAMANVPELAGSRETEKFIYYWRSKAGKDATKLDWVLTWRNWMIKAAEDLQNRGRPVVPPSTAPSLIPQAERCVEHRDQRAGNCRHCAARAKAKPGSAA